MDGYASFPNPNLDQEKAEPLSYPTVATRVEAPCPGSFENTVVLLRGQEVLDGIIKPRNVGSCKFNILYYSGDTNGSYLGRYDLEPVEERSRLTYPSTAQVVRLGCEVGCSGTAILEYQTPYIC